MPRYDYRCPECQVTVESDEPVHRTMLTRTCMTRNPDENEKECRFYRLFPLTARPNVKGGTRIFHGRR